MMMVPSELKRRIVAICMIVAGVGMIIASVFIFDSSCYKWVMMGSGFMMALIGIIVADSTR